MMHSGLYFSYIDFCIECSKLILIDGGILTGRIGYHFFGDPRWITILIDDFRHTSTEYTKHTVSSVFLLLLGLEISHRQA